ncbi:hypothetical protein [Mesonia sp. K4-1]|uniref:hypothetical protein n=1 Tax=Mesonia sp. K4-1 TaxID=2602760 RepID=UPI0011CBF3AA|nr:hypothetical protein [Mesonia sp. K4-1]TXK78891.1 hypothetical protein FT986_03575 [Mesonia sp. K4-1]
MFERLKAYLYYGNTVYGIELIESPNGSILNGTVLKKTKNEVDIDKTFQVDGVESLPEYVSKNKAISLIINTKDVLYKCIHSNQKDGETLINIAFPNINITEFYYQIISNNSNVHIFLCRKIQLEKIVNQFTALKYQVVEVNLSNFLTQYLHLFSENKTFKTSNSIISLEGDSIKYIKRQNLGGVKEGYDFKGLSVSNHHLLSFLASISLLLNFEPLHTNLLESNKKLQKAYLQERFYKLFSNFAIAFLLISLLINFIFFNSNYTAVQELQETSKINSNTKNSINALNAEVEKKQLIVENILNSSSSTSSLFLNEVIHSLPPTVLLTEFDYQPLEKRIRKEKPIEFTNNSITISGTTTEREGFSYWVYELEKMNWISKVSILSYGDIEDNTEFIIKLDIADNE